MTAPLIGVTAGRSTTRSGLASIELVDAYLQAVIRAGGIPVIIPTGLSAADVQELRGRLDGVLLTGGADVDPARFQGRPHPNVYDVDADRDEMEIRLTQTAVETQWPFLGICRGVQVMNVALGGTLYTDIADQFPHALRHDWYPNIPRSYRAHEVTLDATSRLAGILGAQQVPVNSLHHQGLERVADGLRVVAHAPDEMIEAVELPDHRFGFGVQWHPEWLQDMTEMRALFSALVRAAADGHA
jgi:putative glutamine amidotransferase